MKAFNLLIGLTVAALQAAGQNAAPKNVHIKNAAYIGMELSKYYHPNPDSTKNACLEGCVFIKFTIENNKFTNIAYTKSTPVYIRVALAEAFKAIEPLLQIHAKRYSKSTTYIQPFQYTYNRGCELANVFEGKEPGEKEKQIYKDKQADFYHSANSIWDITNFTDGQSGPISCVLLTPIRIGGEMY